jgi:predicted regulator of Ras-like GTPase activity (Roadblock/LC7/MglB family)
MDEESYEPGDEFSPESKRSTAAGRDFTCAAQNLERLTKAQILPDTQPAAEAEEPPLTPPAPFEPPPSADHPQRLIELIHSLPTFHRFSPAPSSPTLIEPMILETENTGTDLPDQEKLQALFLTEEKLNVRRVVELCGELPGIRSCVLTRDDAVVASHNVPENFDLVGMSSTASKMLSAMQESSSQLGIGALPALTLHTERGPLSIVQNNRLTLLVVHADRGFIPGVREKLTATLGELSRMPLALPSAAATSGGMPLPPAAE